MQVKVNQQFNAQTLDHTNHEHEDALIRTNFGGPCTHYF